MTTVKKFIPGTLDKREERVLRVWYKNINKEFGLHQTTTEKQLMAYTFTKNKNQLYYYLVDEWNKEQDKPKTFTIRVKKNKTAVNEEAERMKEAVRSKVITIDEPEMAKLRKALKRCAGQNVIVEYIVDIPKATDELMEIFRKKYKKELKFKQIKGGKWIVQTTELEIPEPYTKFWWKKRASHKFLYNYDMSIFAFWENQGTVYIYPQDEGINAEIIIQSFRDGVHHCVFTPIRNWAVECEEKAKSEKSKGRFKTIINKLNKYEQQYNEGVPPDAFPQICNDIQIDITIEQPFSESKFVEAQSMKKRYKLFRFMNTRENHIEPDDNQFNQSVVMFEKFEEVDRDRLWEIKNELDSAQDFYTFKKDKTCVSSISTLSNNYRLPNKFSETVKQFEIDTGLNFCKIDDIDDHKLSQFIKEATNYNGTVDFQNTQNIYHRQYGMVEDQEEVIACKIDDKEIFHIDQRKAYANFQSCKFYEGFLGKISDFRKTNKINGVGIYRITNLKFPAGKFKDYNDKLKIYIDNNSYPSAELKLLDSYGVTYKIVSGCWGVKPIDFEFSEEMRNTKDNGIAYYSKWVGVCDQHKLNKEFWMKGSRNYFTSLRETHGVSIVKYYENGEGKISFPKKHNYHLGHIAAFITAYTRMNMIEQLMEIEYNSVVRVCVDGIYHTQSDVPLKNVFRIKQEKRFENEAGESYVDMATEKSLVIDEAESREHYAKELHLGPGGCGKTHYNCNDKGLIQMMYLSPPWKLARSKEKEMDMSVSVWARELSSDHENISVIKATANVLIIDEISQLSEDDKLRFFEVYSDLKIIMCGDLKYQLPCIVGEEADDKGFDNIVKHLTNYRCEDPVLLVILNTLRGMIEQDRTKTFINNWVMHKFTELGRVIDVNELQSSYQIDDMLLTGTNDLKDYYTSLFAGKFEKEKYYVTENNRLYSNGDIVIGDMPENCKCEVRHCFTTHSIQGETAQHKLFIDSSRMFDSRMFYTAISRAKVLDQIYIVRNKEQEFKYDFGKIYKITSKSGVYIGSTVQRLEVRFEQHKKAYEKYSKDEGKFLTSFNLINDTDVTIEKIENFKCNDLKDLWKREAEIIREFGSKCVNRTYNEWAE